MTMRSSAWPHSPPLKAKTTNHLSAADFLHLLSPNVAISTLGSNPAASRGPYTCRKCEQRYPSLHALSLHHKNAHASPGFEGAVGIAVEGAADCGVRGASSANKRKARYETLSPAVTAETAVARTAKAKATAATSAAITVKTTATPAAKASALKATAMRLATREDGGAPSRSTEKHSNIVDALRARKSRLPAAQAAPPAAATAAATVAPTAATTVVAAGTVATEAAPAGIPRCGKRARDNCNEKVPGAFAYAVNPSSRAAKRVARRFYALIDAATAAATDADEFAEAPILESSFVERALLPRVTSPAACAADIAVDAAAALVELKTTSNASAPTSPSVPSHPSSLSPSFSTAPPSPVSLASTVSRAVSATAQVPPTSSPPAASASAAAPARGRADFRVSSSPASPATSAVTGTRRIAAAASHARCNVGRFPVSAQPERIDTSATHSLNSAAAPLALQLSAAADALRASASATRPAGSATAAAGGAGSEAAGGGETELRNTLIATLLDRLSQLATMLPQTPASKFQVEQTQQEQQMQQQQDETIPEAQGLPETILQLQPPGLADASSDNYTANSTDNFAENSAMHRGGEWVRAASSSSATFPSSGSETRGNLEGHGSMDYGLDLELRL
ncbi:unnamed protein product [Closterium sp. NIES-54]